MPLTKDQILSIVDVPKPIEVAVSEWGGSVYLKTISFAEGLLFSSFTKSNPEASGLYLLSLTLCDEEGKPLFSFDEMTSMAATTKAIPDLIAKAVSLNSNNNTEDASKNSLASPI